MDLIRTFYAVENENGKLEDLPQANFGCLLENTSSFGNNFITENFSLVGLYQKSHLFAALIRSTSDTTNPHENIIPKYFP